MKAAGTRTKGKASAMKNFKMATPTSGNITKARCRGRADTNGSRGNGMKASGSMAKSKDLASGWELIRIIMLVNGLIISRMDLENMFGIMGIFMRASGRCVCDMVKDVIVFRLEIVILESIFWARRKGVDSIDGRMAIFIVDNLCLELRVGRGLGLKKKDKKIVINMLGLIKMILNMAMENLLGRQVVDI